MTVIALKASQQSALLAAVLDSIPRLARKQLAEVAQTAIDYMDDIDPDPDFEGEHSEDEISTLLALARNSGGAGCIVSDPDSAVDDKPCDENTEDGI